MSAPIKTYRFKGVQLSDWGQGKYSIDKRYKKKGSDEWLSTKTFFANELEELKNLIDQALMEPSEQHQDLIDKLPKPSPQQTTWDDSDEIPF